MTVYDLDPYRAAHTTDAAYRFRQERDRHRRRADRMWLEAMTLFSDYELRLLNDLGYLSQHDRDLLRQAGRDVASRGGAP